MQLAVFAMQSFLGSVLGEANTHDVPALSTTRQAVHDTAAQRWSFCACSQPPLAHWLLPVHTEPFASFAWQAPAPVLQ